MKTAKNTTKQIIKKILINGENLETINTKIPQKRKHRKKILKRTKH